MRSGLSEIQWYGIKEIDDHEDPENDKNDPDDPVHPKPDIGISCPLDLIRKYTLNNVHGENSPQGPDKKNCYR